MRKTPLLVFGSFLLAACGEPPVTPTALTPTDASALSVSEATPYMVLFKGHKVPDDFAAAVSALGGEVIFAHAGVGLAGVSGIDSAGADALAARNDVSGVQADAYVEIETDLANADAESVDSPSNPGGAAFIGLQWNLQAVNAAAAWAAGKTGSPAVTLGILDTGIDYLHPDLVGLVDLDLSRSFLSAAENARVPAWAHPVADLHYHGTHVAATAVSNAYLAAGVATSVRLVGLKVCVPGVAPSFRGTCPTLGTFQAILYAADNGIDVINLSLGGAFLRRLASASGGFGPSFIATINRVFNYAHQKGTTVVVSAGNSARDMDHDGNVYNSYCNAPHVLCVSATGPTGGTRVGNTYVNVQNIDALAGYSNYGRSAISVAAPGGNVLPVRAACSGFTIVTSLLVCRNRFFNSPTSWSGFVVSLGGTSMAAPHVSGLAALVAGDVGHSPSKIAAQIQKSADDLGQPGTDPAYGKGRINVGRGVGAN